jgi:molecular chaperone GrpE
MSEFAPPGVPVHATERSAQALTPEAIDTLLADFRRWLEQAAMPPVDGAAPPPPPAEPVDLHTLLGQFLAVRHEVNLQTKAVRAQQEQNTESLRQLSTALDALWKAQATATQAQQQAVDEEVRPLLKALVNLHDALSLASREAQRVQDTLLPALAELATEPAALPLALESVEAPPLDAPRRPLLARMLGVRGVDEGRISDWQRRMRTALEQAALTRHQEYQATERDRSERGRQSADRVRQFLGSLVTGYRMGLQRVERALDQQGLEPIPAVGTIFDPERMEVLEAVADTGRPSGEVIEEVRRGYLWRGRVFRFAQVRVARS